MSNAWLAHHGIKGQKKGLRRWQNLDGSYTPAGRIHYGIGKARERNSSKNVHMTGKYRTKNEEEEVTKPKSKKISFNKYVDSDGELTKSGQERYERLKKRNNAKPKDKRAKDEESLKDPDKWMEDDIKGTKGVLDSTRNFTKSLEELERVTNKPKENKRMDLSSMTDQELRERINRELLERQYNQVFNPPTVNRGREFIKDTLATTGAVLGVASSALAIALSIQQLKNGTGG